MSHDDTAQDPLEFVRKMWSSMGVALPGMITPTLDLDELDKRIADLKAVETWLKMNLNMLQMTTQGLEMQRATLAAVKAMSQQASDAGNAAGATSSDNPFANAAMWPWNMMTAEQTPGESKPQQASQPEDTPRTPPRGGRKAAPREKS